MKYNPNDLLNDKAQIALLRDQDRKNRRARYKELHDERNEIDEAHKKGTDFLKKNKVALAAGLGGVAGWAGSRLATSFGDEAKERRRLKALKKANNLTPEQEEQLKKLKRKRVAIQAISAGTGAAVGGGATYLGRKKIDEKLDKSRERYLDKLNKEYKSQRSSLYKEHEDAYKNIATQNLKDFKEGKSKHILAPANLEDRKSSRFIKVNDNLPDFNKAMLN